jgi:hypothetical protein
LLDLKLGREPENALELAKSVLVPTGQFIQVVGQGSQPVCPLARVLDATFESEVLLGKGDLAGIGEF